MVSVRLKSFRLFSSFSPLSPGFSSCLPVTTSIRISQVGRVSLSISGPSLICAHFRLVWPLLCSSLGASTLVWNLQQRVKYSFLAVSPSPLFCMPTLLSTPTPCPPPSAWYLPALTEKERKHELSISVHATVHSRLHVFKTLGPRWIHHPL